MPWPTTRRIIGTKVPRLDGPEKATGRAKYSYDINRPGMLHAKMLRCPHAHARITSIDTTQAEKAPGVRAVHMIAQANTELYWAGAEVGAVAADTEEHAEDALRLIRVEYAVLPHLVKEHDALTAQASTLANGAPNVGKPAETATNNFGDQLFQNATSVDQTYSIPVISHQCLESHGLVAEWNQDATELTVWASTQAVPGTANALAQNFKLAATRVKCITHYMGGGFGSKFGPDIQGQVAAELARKARAPVKLMLDRAGEVTAGGMRPSSFARIRIAGGEGGVVQAFESNSHACSGVGGAAGLVLPYVYSVVPNRKTSHRVVRMNIQQQRAMRAPGHPQSCFLTEQAFDDLAARLNVNPLEMRIRNLPLNDDNVLKTAPTTWEALRNTIYVREIGIMRDMCNWNQRWHPPGKGAGAVVKTGMGIGMHTWGGGAGRPNPTKVTISADGSVLVQSGSQDLGTGQRTVTAIVAAEVLGLQPRDITVYLGDSTHGPSNASGGSTTCPGTSPAILKAAEAARDALFAAIAPRLNAQPGDLTIEPGHVVNRTNNQRTPWRQACSRLGMTPIQATGDWPTPPQLQKDDQLREEWTRRLTNLQVGGIQVAEVKVDTETGVVRCTHVWAVQDCGMVINKQGCESQVAGGVIMGVNYALFYDRATGRQVNPNMEFYKLGGIQDMPQVHVHMMDMPERGVIGIGEPPTISTAAAVANAVHNALGVRVPNAPFTPERVLAALANRR